MAARWLPNNEEFFVGLVTLLGASETNLTGKNNGFPFLDIFGYLKNTH